MQEILCTTNKAEGTHSPETPCPLVTSAVLVLLLLVVEENMQSRMSSHDLNLHFCAGNTWNILIQPEVTCNIKADDSRTILPCAFQMLQ